MLFFRVSEKFSNTENMQIYNIFRNFMNSNGTFSDFKNMLSGKQINFSEGTELFDSKSITFDQYMEMLKKYNKNQLNADSIDKIRQILT